MVTPEDELIGTRHRGSDHTTSVQGAEDVSKRAPTQRIRLLVEFEQAGIIGLTDEEAGELAGLAMSCYWKRCGELRRDGLIEFIPETEQGAYRKGTAGVARRVSVITTAGRLEALNNG